MQYYAVNFLDKKSNTSAHFKNILLVPLDLN